MSDNQENITVRSSRFGDIEVPKASVITFPTGLIGFPRANHFVMFDHKPPFSWLHSCDDPNLAFVVVDGFDFAQHFKLKAPIGDRDTDLQEGDEYAVLVIVTVRPDPRDTTANLKAPLFVNLKNRRGVQIIYDDPRLTTRFPLWTEKSAEQGAEQPAEATQDPGSKDDSQKQEKK